MTSQLLVRHSLPNSYWMRIDGQKWSIIIISELKSFYDCLNLMVCIRLEWLIQLDTSSCQWSIKPWSLLDGYDWHLVRQRRSRRPHNFSCDCVYAEKLQGNQRGEEILESECAPWKLINYLQTSFSDGICLFSFLFSLSIQLFILTKAKLLPSAAVSLHSVRCCNGKTNISLLYFF